MVNFSKNKKVLMISSQSTDIFWFNYAVKLIFGLELEFFSLSFWILEFIRLEFFWPEAKKKAWTKQFYILPWDVIEKGDLPNTRNMIHKGFLKIPSTQNSYFFTEIQYLKPCSFWPHFKSYHFGELWMFLSQMVSGIFSISQIQNSWPLLFRRNSAVVRKKPFKPNPYKPY